MKGKSVCVYQERKFHIVQSATRNQQHLKQVSTNSNGYIRSRNILYYQGEACGP